MSDNLTITLKSPGQSQQPTPPAPAPAPILPPKPKKRWLRAILFMVLGLVVAGGVFYGSLFAYTKFTAAPAAPATESADQTTQVISKVSKLMILPSETPTIAVVSDLSKLQGQAFFANAHMGDIVLLYAQSKKAILYSPSLNKIVEVAPITGTDTPAQ
jgi:hypothetical protein